MAYKRIASATVWNMSVTNDAARKRARQLLRIGITQKAVAGAMSLSETKFSRWLGGKTDHLDVSAVDGLGRFEADLKREIRSLPGPASLSIRSAEHGAGDPADEFGPVPHFPDRPERPVEALSPRDIEPLTTTQGRTSSGGDVDADQSGGSAGGAPAPRQPSGAEHCAELAAALMGYADWLKEQSEEICHVLYTAAGALAGGEGGGTRAQSPGEAPRAGSGGRRHPARGKR